MTERSDKSRVVAECAELRALASRLVERLVKLEAELTVAQDPANDAAAKPTVEDFMAIRARRKRRGHRG